MARADLNVVLDKLSGKLYGDSELYVTHRHGKTVISNYPRHRDEASYTPHQRELHVNFGQLSKRAKLELSDPERRAYWQQRYDEFKASYDASANSSQKYYFTLRGFVIAQLKNHL